MNFLEYVLTPAEVKILSCNQQADSNSKVQFNVTFKISLFLYSNYFLLKTIYFTTRGTFEAKESIEHEMLIKILAATDYYKYMEYNMNNRDFGRFNYSYGETENWLTISYETF